MIVSDSKALCVLPCALQVTSFLEKFILSESEVQSLRSDPIDLLDAETGKDDGRDKAHIYTSSRHSWERSSMTHAHTVGVTSVLIDPVMMCLCVSQASGRSSRRCGGCRRSGMSAARSSAPSTRARGSSC